MPITITMPALSPTMTEGTLAKWLVSVGDELVAGDAIAEIETDKATMEVEVIDEGIVARLLVEEGTEGVPVNTPICILFEEGEDESVLDTYEPAAAASVPAEAAPDVVVDFPQSPPPVAAPPAASAPAPAAAAVPTERVFASPLARRLAADGGLDIAAVTGSGPHGRIVKRDVEAALAAPAPAPTPIAAPAPIPAAAPVGEAPAASPYEPAFELQKLSPMRKTIARRMSESKQTAPHFYLTVDCELDALLALRADLNARGDGRYKISVNDLIIKAAALALRKVPAANASYTPDGVKLYESADVAVAVATERGLITPVVRQAHIKGLEAISTDMKELAAKARDGKLMPDEYEGGSFTISNLGMFGIKQFDAVINTPQACILAIGAGEKRPVVKDDALAIATVMSCTLSVDHRAVDGAIGAEYLAAFKALIEDPLSMLL